MARPAFSILGETLLNLLTVDIVMVGCLIYSYTCLLDVISILEMFAIPLRFDGGGGGGGGMYSGCVLLLLLFFSSRVDHIPSRKNRQ